MAHGHIAFKRPDGGISIVHLTKEAYLGKVLEEIKDAQGAVIQTIHETLSREQAMLKEESKLRSRGDIPADWETVGKDVELPADREFRNAWGWLTADPKVDIDPVKAVELTKNRLRTERAPLLEKLDVEFQRAVEANDEGYKAEVVAKKNTLRDITATVPAPPADMVAADEAYLNALKAVKIPEEAKPRK